MNNLFKTSYSYQKMITICIILGPLLLPYGVSGISLSLFLYLVIIAASLLLNRFKISDIKHPYALCFLYTTFVVNIISVICYGQTYFSIGEVILFLMLCLSSHYFNVDYGMRIYRNLVYFTCIIFFIQELNYYIFGLRFSALLPFLPLIYSDDFIEGGMQGYMELQANIDRSSSIFLEPAQFAQFLIPFAAISLFRERVFKCSFDLVLVIFVLFILRSGNGLLLLLLLFVCWIFWTKITRKNALLLLISFIILALSALYYLNTESGSLLLERTAELDSDNTSTSGFARIFRGYFIWSDIPLINQIFGITNDVLNMNWQSYPSHSLFLADDFYINTFQSRLIYSGVLGVIIYLYWLKKEYNKSSQEGKFILLSFLLLHFIASLPSAMLLLYISLSKKRNCYETNIFPKR